MKQKQCPKCDSYKTASNRMILLIMGALFFFPISVIFMIFLGIVGLILSWAISVSMVAMALLPTRYIKGWMCMQCQYRWTKDPNTYSGPTGPKIRLV